MPTHRMVSIDELSQYLHLPEKAVAKELGICLTSLKKLCRQHGITRWPYRKLKSLDKKFAKADGSTGVVEDPETLKARAEELRKEKMALAFSYGIKVGKEGGAGGADSLEKGAETCGAGDESPESSSGRETPPTDVSDMLSVEDMLSSEIAKAVSNPRKDPEADGTSELSSGSTPSSVMAKSAPHVWPAHGSRDSPSSIPTPPGDEPFHTVGDTVGEGVDADMLNEAACHVMASTALMEDSRMSACISWEAPSLDDSVVEPSGDCDGETQTKSTAPMSMSCTGMACSPDFPVCASSSKKKAGDKKALAGKGGAPAISKAQHSARRGAVDKKGASERAQDVSTRGGKVEEKTGRGEREDDEEAEEVGAERSGGRFEIDDDLTVMDHDLKDHDFFGGMSVMSTMSTVDGDDAGYHVHASSYHARQPGPVPHAARSKTSGGRAHGHALQSALVSSEALQPLQSSKDDSTLFGNPLENALELELPHDDSLTTVSKDSILGESWETHNWPGGIKEECGGRGGTSTGRSGQANRKRLRDSLPDTPEAITPGTREIKSWFPAASPAASPGKKARSRRPSASSAPDTATAASASAPTPVASQPMPLAPPSPIAEHGIRDAAGPSIQPAAVLASPSSSSSSSIPLKHKRRIKASEAAEPSCSDVSCSEVHTPSPHASSKLPAAPAAAAALAAPARTTRSSIAAAAAAAAEKACGGRMTRSRRNASS